MVATQYGLRFIRKKKKNRDACSNENPNNMCMEMGILDDKSFDSVQSSTKIHRKLTVGVAAEILAINTHPSTQ